MLWVLLCKCRAAFRLRRIKKQVNLPYCSYAVKPPYEAFLTRVVVILKIVLVLCGNILDA